MLKTIVLLNIFVEIMIFFIFGNIINSFIANFEQFNMFLLNKVLISFHKRYLTDPKILNNSAT